MTKGTAIAQIIPILLSPVLTRIYTPEDFGVFAIYFAIVSIFSVIASGRYELAIMLPKKHANAVEVLACALISAFLTVALVLILIIVLEFKNVILFNGSLDNFLYFIPLSILLVSIFNVLINWLGRRKKFKKLALNKVYQSLTLSSSQIAVGLTKFSSVGLVFGWLFAQLIAVTYLSKQVLKKDAVLLRRLTFSGIFGAAKKYIRFPLVNALSALLNTGSMQFTIIVFSKFFGAAFTGLLSLAEKILLMPMSLIGASVGQVYFQKASVLRAEKVELKKLTKEIHTKLILIGLVPSVLTLIYGEELFSFVFGENWRAAGEYAKLLSIWVFLVFITSPLSHLLTVYEKHYQSLLFNSVLFFSRISSIVIGALVFEDAFYAVMMYSFAGALAWLVMIYYLFSLVDSNFFETTTFVLPPVAFLAMILMLNL